MQTQREGVNPLDRRGALLLLAALAWPAVSYAEDAAAALRRAGGCVLVLRHASTVPGVGDPPEFQLGTCSTQRNLSADGQAEARRIGAWFRHHQLEPRTVLTSAWCRCIDTAQLAFGRHTPWPALNSSFGDRYPATDATPSLRQALRAVPPGQFEVWVTHQVNITAIAGEVPAQAEGFVLDTDAKLRMRTRFGG
ncbi:MAG: histidine phosphatase family protein [Ferruginibacter sp.]|nr:histidine phosphatase family protein [Rhodoferax sp.]